MGVGDAFGEAVPGAGVIHGSGAEEASRAGESAQGEVDNQVSNDGRITLPRPLAFVFGGGGSLGAIQVGQLEALQETGLQPDIVVGTSIGSLNGAITAEDPRGASHKLANIWPTVTEQDVAPGGINRAITAFRPNRTNLVSHDGVVKMIETHLQARRFRDLEVPFGAVTFNAHTNLITTMTSGALEPALVASCSIPGVFPPVRYDDMLLYDGGMGANVPIRQAIAMGAKSLIIFDCMFPGTAYREPANMQGSLLFFMTTILRQQVFGDLNLAISQMPVVYLPGPREIPKLGPAFILDFSKTSEMMEGAYEATREYLDTASCDGSAGIYWPPLHNPTSY